MSPSFFPTLLHRLLIFLHVIEALLLLAFAGVLFLLSSGAAFNVVDAVFQSSGAVLFYHDRALGFYAAYLLLLFVFSTCASLIYTKWKRGSPSVETAKLKRIFVYHPLMWHVMKLRRIGDPQAAAGVNANELTTQKSVDQSLDSEGNPQFKRGKTRRLSDDILVIHAISLSLPCLLLQLYVRSFLIASTSSLWSLFHSVNPSSPSSSLATFVSDFQLVTICVHLFVYILTVATFVDERWKQKSTAAVILRRGGVIGVWKSEIVLVEGAVVPSSSIHNDNDDGDIEKQIVRSKNLDDISGCRNNNSNNDEDEDEARVTCFSCLESRPRRCVLLLLTAWSLLVVFTLPNLLQLFVRGRSIAAVLLAWTFNVLPLPLIVNNKSCLRAPSRSLFVVSIVIAYELLSNVYLWSVFYEIGSGSTSSRTLT